MDADDPRHGQRRGYRAHRKDGESACGPCRRAEARSQAQYQLAKMHGTRYAQPGFGVTRRIQALVTLGWTQRDIAARMGVSTNAVTMWESERVPTVNAATATRIKAVYAELSMRLAPDTYGSRRARLRAMRRRYAPPLSYIDIDDPLEEPAMNENLTRWHTFEERFWGRIDKGAGDECWLWMGRLTAKGYGGQIGYQKRYYYPHQLSYIVHVGPIPEGLVIDHLCRVRNCVNPSHLEPVTALENTERGVAARWSEPCPNGHPPEHRRTMPSGTTLCTECRRVSDTKRYERDRDRRREAGRRQHLARQAYVDPVVVQRILGGEWHMKCTRAEKVAVVATWAGSLHQLEQLTGWKTARYVAREAEDVEVA